MSAGGELLDIRLFHTNSILTKALVPIAQCVSDIGERKGHTVSYYLEGLNNSVWFLACAVKLTNCEGKLLASISMILPWRVATYASWKPDSLATYNNAFTSLWGTGTLLFLHSVSLAEC